MGRAGAARRQTHQEIFTQSRAMGIDGVTNWGDSFVKLVLTYQFLDWHSTLATRRRLLYNQRPGLPRRSRFGLRLGGPAASACPNRSAVPNSSSPPGKLVATCETTFAGYVVNRDKLGHMLAARNLDAQLPMAAANSRPLTCRMAARNTSTTATTTTPSGHLPCPPRA